jgi:RNA 3'-terminal phosphate cyclase-like protein
VIFTCPSVRAIKSGFDFTNIGRIAKIRGIAYASLLPISPSLIVLTSSAYSHSVRVSPQLANRLVAAARSVLNRYIPDIYIYTDVYRGEDSGKCVAVYPVLSPTRVDFLTLAGLPDTPLPSSPLPPPTSSTLPKPPPAHLPLPPPVPTPKHPAGHHPYQKISECRSRGCCSRRFGEVDVWIADGSGWLVRCWCLEERMSEGL